MVPGDGVLLPTPGLPATERLAEGDAPLLQAEHEFCSQWLGHKLPNDIQMTVYGSGSS